MEVMTHQLQTLSLMQLHVSSQFITKNIIGQEYLLVPQQNWTPCESTVENFLESKPGLPNPQLATSLTILVEILFVLLKLWSL